MIVAICDDELSDPVDSDAGQAVELSFTVAVASELLLELAVRVEDLDSVVGGVRDCDDVSRSSGDSSRPCEASFFAPPTPQAEHLASFFQVLTSSTCIDSETYIINTRYYIFPVLVYRLIN